MSWTPERIEQLKSAWTKGLSAAQIAAELGSVSRNAVIGKLHRLGLNRGRLAGRRKSAGPRLNLQRQPPPRSRPTPPAPTREPRLRLPELSPPPTDRIRLVTLTATSCRWPEGDPKHWDFHFCGRPAKPGSPYCPHPAARAVRRRTTQAPSTSTTETTHAEA
ncbi:MAG: GcrA family cell cycle regulator [Hyphomicrobiales bacterium]|nr:GcrA family cell cycle regulator [Hyphomicrobiales bacterium]